ncbi:MULTISPECIES: hypothetical protein [Bradyrhizobium]|uniref:hypothetical protein n=1 Tax=Bradyrhizobium TaxID=374 RepID=UPI000231D025|nr:hypothetical protein [Bradyrhizobium japonicum]KMJ98911.1 hypothetical protein CF64_12085 [Bradyrhizobium japonicum]MCS3539987.1 hypothetical protein [Bradyrhizobium japonicum]MCS3992810.1 hypothetical protein [Bradyrhizobium japonicum]MCS4021258.1 hypothetical protein [Bradyrhizobium japonicum]MCS4208367.1 hypothetical protein [Bradyrhizobium japonicum]
MHMTTLERPADSADAFSRRLAIQQRKREKTLQRLARLRKKASAEIDRLIAFLDASDPYVMTELEDDISADLEDEDPAEDDDPAENDLDDEPSLGSIERHPSCYGPDGRNWSGDQIAWADGGTKDLEDEHDGAEPGEDEEPSLGACEGHTDQRVAWRATSVSDYELDHSESGIGDVDGLLEQVGTQDWQQGAMA